MRNVTRAGGRCVRVTRAASLSRGGAAGVTQTRVTPSRPCDGALRVYGGHDQRARPRRLRDRRRAPRKRAAPAVAAAAQGRRLRPLPVEPRASRRPCCARVPKPQRVKSKMGGHPSLGGAPPSPVTLPSSSQTPGGPVEACHQQGRGGKSQRTDENASSRAVPTFLAAEKYNKFRVRRTAQILRVVQRQTPPGTGSNPDSRRPGHVAIEADHQC